MGLKTKLLTILLLLGWTTMGMCGCGAKEPQQQAVEPTPTAMTEDTKETLYFWYADEAMTDYISSAAVAFGEKENVRVLPQLVSDSEFLEAINAASLQEEQVPDAYLISNDSLEKAYMAGLAVEVQDVAGVLNSENFPEAALNAIMYKDDRTAYPLYFETSVLLYNETYLQEWAMQRAIREAESLEMTYDEATLNARRDELMGNVVPKTIDEMLNMANNFDPPEQVDGIFKWDVSDIFYNYYFVGNYMQVGGDTGDDSTKININNPEVIACLEVYKALNQFFFIESDTVTYETVMQDFLDGKIVFTIATTDAVAMIEQAKADGSFAYDYGLALMPSPSEQLQGRSLSVTGAVAINGYSEKQELANRFAAFLVQDYAEELYVRSGKVPASLTTNVEHDALQIFKEEYATSISLPKMIETSNYWIQLEILFSKVWNGGDVVSLVAELAAQIDSQINTAK